jgi:alpha-beta hydrolase superfamily lysophospholipase
MHEENVIIFIHGAWVTPMCWRYFEPFFADRGFHTLAPAWPCKGRNVEDQLEHPDPRLAQVGIAEIVAHYKDIIREQAKPPILIGHSFGGLIVQILLDQGFGAAGIAISSIPPRGVSPIRLSRQSLRRLRELFGTPFSWRKILAPPQPDKHEQALRQAQGIQMHLVRESGKIFWQLFTRAAVVNFRNQNRAPLLLVGCGKDTYFPVETEQRIHERYRVSKARTDFALFPDLTHVSIAEPGHAALAAYCAAWVHARLAERQTVETGGDEVARIAVCH